MGYTNDCDIWSWGVMLCEMIGGFNPFSGGNIQQTFDNIINLNINWPKNMSKLCKKLLETIFVHDPNMRAKVFDIKNNLYFKDIKEWSNLDSLLTPEQNNNLLNKLTEAKVNKDNEMSPNMFLTKKQKL
jgi:serine/threonine protein kinase